MEEEIKDQLASIPPEERAAAWEKYVRDEVNSLLDIYLPEAITGNVGIKYINPVKSISPKTGKSEIDDKHATGVSIVINFEFADAVEFFDDDPTKTE